MKKKLLLVIPLVMAFAAGCKVIESDCTAKREPRGCTLAKVPIRFSEAGDESTKSVVSQSVEYFHDAFLFAFWASGADAGDVCVADGAPVAIHTANKSFDWELPMDEAIEVMAIINADNAIRNQLAQWTASGVNLKKSDLTAMTFSCQSASELEALQSEGNNMPMTGTATTTLTQSNRDLTIPVKRLFARFDITIDVSNWASDGWTVNAARVSGARSNTEVPYFKTGTGAGFKQTDPSKLKLVDTSTDNDIQDLNFRDEGNRSKAVTYYFLENCQDVSSSAGKWDSVSEDLGNLVDNCSYLKIIVTATKAGFGRRSFGYRIYLDSSTGSAMNTRFNIIRNTIRSIVLKLGAPQDSFLWTNASEVTVQPGQTVSIPFQTSLSSSELAFFPPSGKLEYVSHSLSGSNGTATFKANDNADEGAYILRGGNSSGEIWDEVNVQIENPISLTVSVPAERYAFKRFTVTISARSQYESVFQNIELRSDSPDIQVVSSTNIYYSSVNGTDDVVNKRFTLLCTGISNTVMKACNSISDVVYKEFNVTCQAPSVLFIDTNSSPYSGNAFSGYDSFGAPIYDVPITGETVSGYLEFLDNSGLDIYIKPEDLALGTFQFTHLDGFSTGNIRFISSADAYKFDSNLETWDYLEGFNPDNCTFWSGLFSPRLQLLSQSGSMVLEDAICLNVRNPFADWFPSGNSQPYHYSIVLDGSSDYTNSQYLYHDWPVTSDLQPIVLSAGNVNTGKAGRPAYRLVYEDYPEEIDYVSVANDLHNYGCISIGNSITHSITGDVFTMLWGKVDVIREFYVYAGYQFDQKNYLDSWSTPNNGGNLSRLIPYIYSPYLNIAGYQLKNIVRTSATASTGINAINPSEDFYKETVRQEHWWPHYTTDSNDSSHSTLWDCEGAIENRSCLLQNKVVIYPTPKTVTSDGELSYYELQYAGPRVSSHLPPVLGHNGNHADFIYSFRSVAYWNPPMFEFTISKINPRNNPSIQTVSSTGEKYLQIGDYTRIRFFWKMKKANLNMINSYDTRYAINFNQVFQTTYSNTTDPSYQMYYFGNALFQTIATATAYYDPRRNVRERMKLYTPSVPFFRLQGNTVHAAFDGSFLGSYTEENVSDSHIMGQAFGEADSFWLPGNQIE